MDDLEVVPTDTLNKMLEMQIRIEQLEAALREIIMCWNYEQCAELARAALGEKKNG